MIYSYSFLHDGSQIGLIGYVLASVSALQSTSARATCSEDLGLRTQVGVLFDDAMLSTIATAQVQHCSPDFTHYLLEPACERQKDSRDNESSN